MCKPKVCRVTEQDLDNLQVGDKVITRDGSKFVVDRVEINKELEYPYRIMVRYSYEKPEDAAPFTYFGNGRLFQGIESSLDIMSIRKRPMFCVKNTTFGEF